MGTGVQERDKLPTGLVSGGKDNVGKSEGFLAPPWTPAPLCDLEQIA